MDSLFPKQTNNILPAAPITKPIWPEEMHVTSNEGPVSDFMLGPDSRGRDDEDFAYSDNIVNHVSELVEDAGDGEWEAYAAKIPGLMHSESFDNATLSKNETANGDGAANAMLNGASLSKLVLSSDVNQGVAKKQFARTLSNGSGSISGSNLDFSADIEDIENGSGTASPSSSTSNLTASALPYIPTLALATTVSVRPVGINSSSGFIFQQPAQPVAGLGSAGTLQIHSATAINGRPPAITSINQSNPSITTVKAGADISAHGIRPAAVATVRPAGQVQSAVAPVRPMRPPQATQPASTMVSTSNTIPVVAPPAVANAPVLYASSTVSKNSAVVAQPSARPVSVRPVLANAASATTAAPSVSTPAPTASQTPPTESKKLPAAQSTSQPASQSTSQPATQQSSSSNASSAPAKPATTNGVSTTPAATSSTAASLATRPPMTKAMLKMKVNPKTFPTNPDYARFFVIKSFSEDDVHKSIKYSIWASTDSGNHRLDKAYHESASKGPIYLFFSVNASGHFQGMAQMVSPVDYHTSSTVWAQDKWKGIFEVKWAFIKDIPNHALRNIKLSNNENKPVTNSRDTQEILLDPGREILQIFHQYSTKTSILDDFDEYDKRHPVPEAAPVVVPTPPRASSRDSSATSSNHNTLTKTNSKAGSNSATRNGTEVATQN